MQYEDLRSYMITRHDVVLQQIETISEKDVEIQGLNDEIDSLNKTIEQKEEKIAELEKNFDNLKKELSEEMIRHSITSQSLENANKKIGILDLNVKDYKQ